MPLTVRRAVPGDASVIAEYNQRLAQETEGRSLDGPTIAAGVAAVLEDSSRGTYFVAEDEGRVVGQLMITLEWSDWRNGWLWWIQSVYVHADARRLGVFRALHHHAVAEARHRGDVVGIRLYVEKENVSARATYARLGMQETGYLVLERCPL